MNKIILISFVLLTSVSYGQKKVSANYAKEVECMGVELYGSVTLKTWGAGKNRADALEQARKEAINAVLFKGIRNGKNDCGVAPLLNEANIREKKSRLL